MGRIKRVDAQSSDNYRSLLCEVIDDFETCDELTAERGRTGPMDLRPCFPYQVGVRIQVDRNAVPRDELRDTHGFQCVSLIVIAAGRFHLEDAGLQDSIFKPCRFGIYLLLSMLRTGTLGTKSVQRRRNS